MFRITGIQSCSICCKPLPSTTVGLQPKPSLIGLRTDTTIRSLLLCRCGPATRVTILKDKMTGHPSGTAYVQFLTSTQAAAALALAGSLLLQRPIAVMPKPSKPSYALPVITSHASIPDASHRVAAQPYNAFVSYQSGRGEYAPRGRGRGRGRASRGQQHFSRGGRTASRGGRGSETAKSNVYIRPGMKQ